MIKSGVINKNRRSNIKTFAKNQSTNLQRFCSVVAKLSYSLNNKIPFSSSSSLHASPLLSPFSV
jgi:hypothetical protein